ncbi:zinc-finger double domain-containing protein [Phthorimaea operculella]|nr:zinc-finger double domain-containing protein [Phthorimaea operculella]
MSCVLCGLSLDLDGYKVQHIGQKAVQTIKQTSIDRGDDIADSLLNVESVTVHEYCRKKYNRRDYDGKLVKFSAPKQKPADCNSDVVFQYIPISLNKSQSHVQKQSMINVAKCADASSSGHTQKISPQSIAAATSADNGTSIQTNSINDVFKKFDRCLESPVVLTDSTEHDLETKHFPDIEDNFSDQTSGKASVLEPKPDCEQSSTKEEDPTKPFPFQHNCLFCAKEVTLRRSKKSYGNRITKPQTQEKILCALRKKPNPSTMKIMRRIQDTDLVQMKAHYHMTCYTAVVQGFGELPTEGKKKKLRKRPECPYVLATIEKVCRYIDESGRTEFTKTELKNAITSDDYEPCWPTIETKLKNKYEGKIYFNPIPGRSTLVTVVKDPGLGGSAVIQPWNLNSTELGGQPEAVEALKNKRKYYMTNKELAVKEKYKKNCLKIKEKEHRRLEDLGNYGDILRQIGCNIFIHHFEPKVFLICWECIALLRNVKRFQQKIMIAQKLWSTEVEEPPKSLSTLSVTAPSTASVSCTDEEQKGNVQPEIVTVEVFSEKNMQQIEDDKPIVKEIDVSYDTFDDDTKNIETDFKDTDDDDNDDLEYEERMRPKLNRRKAQVKRMKNCDLDQDSDVPTKSTKQPKMRKYSSEDPDWVANYWLDTEVNSDHFKNLEQKCVKCLSEVAENHYELCHSEENPFVCDICESTFARNDEKESHVASHYYVFSCEFCGYKCYNETHMRGHVETHRKLLQCLECFAAFETFDTLKEHFTNLHRYAECDYCGKQFAHKRIVATHIERNHLPQNNKCTICNTTYSNNTQKKRHMRIKHRIERTESAYCVQCDRQFDNETQLRLHVYHSIKHKHEWRQERSSFIFFVFLYSRKQVKRQLKCPECPNVYLRKDSLKNHYNLVHAKKKEFYCNYCDKAFLNKEKHKRHMRVRHEGYKLPKNKLCNICGRGFSCKLILENHIRTHTGERPFACPHCTSSFAQKVALRSHIAHVHEKRQRTAGGTKQRQSNKQPTFIDSNIGLI